MLAVFSYEGVSMEYTPNADVAAGVVVVVGDTVAVAVRDLEADVIGTLQIQGVFLMPKAVLSTSAIAQGVKVYWDAGSEVVTTTAGSNKVAGYTVLAAGATDATVAVRLARA